MINWKGFGRKLTSLIEVLTLDLSKGTQENYETPVRISGVPEDLPMPLRFLGCASAFSFASEESYEALQDRFLDS
jgi:hypothetical protein